jgi:hypothetical protein
VKPTSTSARLPGIIKEFFSSILEGFVICVTTRVFEILQNGVDRERQKTQETREQQ